MARNCIMCGEPAGSREHVFPAAFGGRRMNKGIYCETHNNELGHHVVELLKTLGYFNASLGVRSDHHDEPKPHLIETPQGSRYQILHNNIEVAPPPPLSQTPELWGKETTLSFASISQRDRWITQQRDNGFEFHSSTSGESRKEYFTTPISQRFDFGSDSFRSAVAYVALTHMAHYFPGMANTEAFSSIRKCVMGEEKIADRVWWVDPAGVSIPQESSFSSVHSTIVAISGETGRVTALITFFNHLCLAVDLGVVNPSISQRVTTLIDPLAERPGQDKDIIVIRDDLPCQIPTADEGKIYICLIINKKKPNPVEEILKSHHEEYMRIFVRKILMRVLLIQEKTAPERSSGFLEIVEEQSQRILNMLSLGIKTVLEQPPELPAQMLHALSEVIEKDLNSPYGISKKTMGYLNLAKAAFANELIRLNDTDALNADVLAQLFSEGYGIAIVLRPVMHEVIRST